MKTLSVVCARSGSKGMKNKCMAKVNGKMIVEYAIEYSLMLGSGVTTVVSTDIPDLIDYCVKKKISYIRREADLCRDESRIECALADAIEKKGKGYAYCSLVHGNIATRYPEIFHEAVTFLETHKEYDAVISMQNVEKFHPEWMLEYNDSFLPKQNQTQYRRQALPQKMIHDGHTLLFKSEEFYKRHVGLIPYNKGYMYSTYGDKIKPLIHDEVVIDIDTKKDSQLTEAFMRPRQNKKR